MSILYVNIMVFNILELKAKKDLQCAYVARGWKDTMIQSSGFLHVFSFVSLSCHLLGNVTIRA